jgi:hypothetical protein
MLNLLYLFSREACPAKIKTKPGTKNEYPKHVRPLGTS